MTEQRIEPHKVTKPIQLLAAWLVGLVLTNVSFLVAAVQLGANDWERRALVISAIANVPIFLLALFVLQTRFRAELQEDTYYAEYLSKKTTAVVRVDKNTAQDTKIDVLERDLARLINHAKNQPSLNTPDPIPANSEALDWSDWLVALNKIHPRFKELREALREADIPLAEIFGKINDGAPSKWIISINHQLPFSNKIHLLRTIIPYGFDGIQYWTPQREAGEDEDVYIGSYGGDSYAKVTIELEELLEKNVEIVDLKHYYAHNKVMAENAHEDD
ncbi:hypothetical protein [Delftia sp. RIT313]|uniref:hypothetical protein n=1 Tax=Delftia sp. RIT313 TaxID=1468410 RepID=UPI000445C146|nr:hypothetical protein [Delftia sp. RIT313]EZP46767.1 hypothetical protein BW39_05703 [Delftia sp. RIT313]